MKLNVAYFAIDIDKNASYSVNYRVVITFCLALTKFKYVLHFLRFFLPISASSLKRF